jgi:hypothetical protein
VAIPTTQVSLLVQKAQLLPKLVAALTILQLVALLQT